VAAGAGLAGGVQAEILKKDRAAMRRRLLRFEDVIRQYTVAANGAVSRGRALYYGETIGIWAC